MLCVRLAGAVAEAPSARLPDGAGPWVVRAYFDSKTQLNLAAARNPPWEVRHDQRHALFEVANRFEYARLLGLGLRLAIDPERTLLARDPGAALRSIPAFGCYRTVEETLAGIDALAAAQPGFASVIDIGDSWEKTRDASRGHDLKVLRLSNAAVAGSKPRMFVQGALHAREYATAETVMRFGEWLLAGYAAGDADARMLLDHHELYLLPQANPDGRKKAEAGLLWRKNTNEAYCGATSNFRGADLNRNYPFEWGAHGGSSGEGCDDAFRGAVAASEPETAAIVAYLRTLFPPRRPPDLTTPAPADSSGVFVDVHSFGELVMWPWGFAEALAPNGVALRTLGRRLAWFNGYRPQAGIELYVTDGGSRDFVYGELGVAAYGFEIGSAFFEPCESFESRVLDQNLAALRYLLRSARRPYQWPAGPSITDFASAPVEAGESARVIGRADDAAFSSANGSEPVDAVAAVALFLDQTPWAGTIEPTRLAQAADGAFDSAVEWFHADLPALAAAGSHRVHARAEDAGGVGPSHALALTVLPAGSSGRLVGEVRNANTGSLLAVPARVQLGGAATLALPGESASYTLRALPGTHALRADAPGYAPLEPVAITLAAGQTQARDLALVPICTLLADGGDAGLGQFNADPPWGIGSERVHSPPAAFTDSPAGDYAANTDASLRTPSLDLRDVHHLRLRFQSWCDTEAFFDRGRVEISANGGPWNELWSCSGSTQWQAVELDLDALAGVSDARIRFRLTSDAAVQREGWSIDDIELSGAGLVCGGTPDGLHADGFE
ncbi:MAG: hypothetical protein OMOMHJEC_01270 [Xanthomonadales bacterium]|nr:hypothetical protein [Xanthomonadales bacterium]